MKTAAILKMEKPKTPTELRRFLGMVNQLSKFSPYIATVMKPLREILSTKKSWCWGNFQEQAFAKVKSELIKPTVLALYDPAELKICADVSPMDWGLCSYNNIPNNGDQWLTHPEL